MNIIKHKKSWMLPAIGFIAICLTSQSKAAVLVTFEQLGSDVVATWTGTFDPSGGTLISPFSFNAAGSNSTDLYFSQSSTAALYGGGTSTATTLSGPVFDSVTGAVAFGFFNSGGRFIADASGYDATTPKDFDASLHTMTWNSRTLSEIGAESFNNTLAYTSANGVDTISYTTAVPEPSTAALLGLVGGLALLQRRRR